MLLNGNQKHHMVGWFHQRLRLIHDAACTPMTSFNSPRRAISFSGFIASVTSQCQQYLQVKAEDDEDATTGQVASYKYLSDPFLRVRDIAPSMFCPGGNSCLFIIRHHFPNHFMIQRFS
jgi:hypothetical protein